MKESNPRRSVLRSIVRTLQQPNEGSDPQRSFRHQAGPLFAKPQHVVGREKELRVLNECLDRITSLQETELIMIHGHSGSGKSSIVNSFVKSLPERVFFAQGKFNQLQSSSPYAALATASDQLCRQIMRREDSTEIRDRVRAVLGADISLMGNLVPRLAEMTKDGSSVERPLASGGQLFTRFKLLFRTFFRSVATTETPIIFSMTCSGQIVGHWTC